MLTIVCVLLIAVMLLVRRERAPIWSFCISWLICLLPLAAGIIEYLGVNAQAAGYAAELSAFLACFFAGVLWHRAFTRPSAHPSEAEQEELLLRDFRRTLPIAFVCWIAALLATA